MSCTPSDVHDHLGQPAVRRRLDAQVVVRDRLDFVTQRVARRVERFAPGRAGQAAGAYVDFEAGEQQGFGVETVQQFLQPVEEEVLAVVAAQLHLHTLQRLYRGEVLDDGREQGLRRFGEERVEVGGADAQAQIGGVF